MAGKGFTLIEVIIVLVIIGVLLSAIGFAPPTRERHLQTEADRLIALLQLARQEALLSATPMAVAFHAEGYQFYRSQQDEWGLIDEDVFRPRYLDDDFTIELSLPEEQGDQVTLPWLGTEEELELPKVFFSPTGEITPFSVTLGVESISQPLVIEGSFQGVIDWAE